MPVSSKFMAYTSKTLNVSEKTLSKCALSGVSVFYFYKIIYPKLLKLYNEQKYILQKKHHENGVITNSSLSKSVPAVNKEFFMEILKLLKIIFPSLWCRPTIFLSLHTLTLIARTFMSIKIATVEGKMVKYIVQKDFSKFSMILATFIALSLPATFLNSCIRFLENHVALAFRTKLVEYTYKLYFKNQCYYKVSNMDSRIENVDHCLTDDISTFCQSIAHLYSHLTKPILDCTLLTYSFLLLAKKGGGAGTPGVALACLVVGLTGRILKTISPKFGTLVSEEQKKKAYLRFMHSRILTNSEEIAFYGGHKIEHGNIASAYNSLISQMKYIFNQKLWYIMIEQFLMKYIWTTTGTVMIAIPLLTSKKEEDVESIEPNNLVSDRTEYLTTARSLNSKSSDALERIFTSYKEIVELAGYTSRVSSMMTVLEDMQSEKYVRAAVKDTSQTSWTNCNVVFKDGVPIVNGVVYGSLDGAIQIDDVPIVTPNGDIVLPSLTIKVTRDMHLLISGPNGCGKSSLFRILGGLWPVYAGRLCKPPTKEMFYIPQRPYMTVGTLRDQVIYPDSKYDMKKKGFTDDDLLTILNIAHLSHIIDREGGWNVIQDWKDVLSGGEKQRMGMARLFYRKPKFALLDECTSAVSIDVEGQMYQAVKDAGITLLTITHRPSLWKFHTHILQMDGEGGWTVEKMDSNKRLSLKDEKQNLETVLSDIPTKMDRLRELCYILGEDSTLIEELEESTERTKSMCEDN